jgi:hypothetical protein
MKKEDKINLVTLISKFLTVNGIPNHIVQEENIHIVVINHKDIPENGINHIILRHIVNTTNFKRAQFGALEFVFVFEVTEDANPFSK